MFRSDADLFDREQQLRIQAGQVMKELRESDADWQTAWKSHPVAVAYRALLREAWARPTKREA